MSRAVAAFVASIAVVPWVVAPAAHADEAALGLSHDGIHWDDALDRPLFEAQVRWVPGDVRTADFWVRNQQSDLGRLTVDLTRTRRDALLATGWLQISARAGDRPWTAVSATDTLQLVDNSVLAPGEPMLVQVRVAFDDDAPNGTRVLGTDLDIRATLADADAVASGGESSPGSGGGDGGNADEASGSHAADGTDGGGAAVLPGTGSGIPTWLPPLAVLLIGAGGFAVGRRPVDRQGRLLSRS